MSLVKCNNCGRPVSDRAAVCPHCGCDPHAVKNPKLMACPHCGALISKKANVCPQCGKAPNANSSQYQNAVGGGSSDIEEYEYAEETTANRGLQGLVGILAVVALVFAGILYSGSRYYNGKTLKFSIDTCAVDTESWAVDTNAVDTCAIDTTLPEPDYSAPDPAYYDGPESYAQPEEEAGFKSNSDVMDFVVGNSYSHDGITLRITADAVYANDNKISTSRPVFRKLSLSKGVITARPSISITVMRDDNRLVDNSNGDSYY